MLQQLEDDIFLTMRVITHAAGNAQRQVDDLRDGLACAHAAAMAQQQIAGRSLETAGSAAVAVRQLAGATRDTARRADEALMLLDDAEDLAQAAIVHGAALELETGRVAGQARNLEALSRRGTMLALNAGLEAARQGAGAGGFSVIADECKTLAANMRAAAGELAQDIARLEAAAAQNRLAMKKMQGVTRQLGQALAAAGEGSAGQRQLGEAALAALDESAGQELRLRDGAAQLGALTVAAMEGAGRAQAGGKAMTGLLERLTRRSVVFLRNSNHGSRRRLERVPVKAPGEITWQGETCMAMTVEISGGGCVLLPFGAATGAPVRPGASARLHLEGIGALPVTFLAQSELGWHLRFDTVEAAAAERIGWLIARVHRENAAMIALAQTTAAEVERVFGQALDSGEIAEDDLLGGDYRPLEGSDPVQYVTSCAGFYESALPPILAAARASSLQPLFALATDRNAYAPVHHPEFSQAQRPGDPVWNDLNARNRRLYDRWITLTGARNRAPYNLRAYIRHTANGGAQPVQVIAAPVLARGRFWGNVQIGCEM